MSMSFGEPIELALLEEVTSDQDPSIRNGWDVSAETRRQIEEIETNIRTNQQPSGTFLFR